MKKQRLLFIFFSAALLLCGSVILSLPKDSHAAAINLPATGQTKCYNTDGAVIPCAGTGQDGDKKMGVAWPNPRFTVSGDCVTDNLTGLIWAKNANLTNGKKTFQEALDFVKSLNAGGGLCGQTDWRLPNMLELESLVNLGFNEADACRSATCNSIANGADWLNTQGITNAQGSNYWSSSRNDGVNGYWEAALSGLASPPTKAGSASVWPVRGGQ